MGPQSRASFAAAMIESQIDPTVDNALAGIISKAANYSGDAYGEGKSITTPLLRETVLHHRHEKPQLPPLWRALVAETFGTAVLIGVGCGTIVSNAGVPTLPMPSLVPAFTFFMVLFVLILTIGPVSGCNLNPQVTLALIMVGDVPVFRGAAYMFAQMLGALAGSGFLHAVAHPIPGSSAQAPCVALGPNVSPLQGFVLEVVLTTLLVFAVLMSFVWRPRVTHLASSLEGPLTVCATLAALIMFGGPLSGAGMNYARVLGPAIVNGGVCWDHHWVWLVGDAIGSFTGVLLAAAISPNSFLPVIRWK
eukprot:c15478_g1_i1.p2 GENE.c15478_g1_i1~~c15478_g1_i1.p2  ORF type:complete len:306 (-),score=36.04 c15478_g1_i1:468-1385(-)